MSTTMTQERPKRREALRSAAAWSLVGSFVYAACQWGILIATVRLTSPADVGSLSLGFAISAPVFLFLQLRLRSASATDVRYEFGIFEYVGIRIICICLANIVTFIICMCVHLSSAQLSIVMWVALAKSAESGSDLLYGFSQRANNMRTVSLSMIGRGALALCFFACLLTYTHSLAYGLAGLFLAWTLVLLAFDIPSTFATLHRAGNHSLRFRGLSRASASLALATLPLGISTMLMSLSSNMPRFFIQKYLGATELGIFAAMGYFAMAASVFVTALAESGIARMARHINDGDNVSAKRLLSQIVTATFLLSMAGLVGSLAFGRQLIGFIYSGPYASAFGLLLWMMVVSGIANVASVYGFVLVAGRRFKSYMRSLIALTIGMFATCALLIPRWGAKGAVFACAVAYAVQLVWSFSETELMFKKLPFQSVSLFLQP